VDQVLKKKSVDENVAADLILWYRDKARTAIETNAPEALGPLDSDCDRLVRLLSQPKTITICFLGHSGVGKSTLLNALAAEARQVLPAGGIGPLTAMATEVRYSDQAYFEATYQPRHHLIRVCFALEQRLKRMNDGKVIESAKATIDHELDAEAREDLLTELESGDTSSGASADPIDGYIKQAKQIVTGDQFSSISLEYLLDALRIACDLAPISGFNLNSEDAPRIERVRAALRLAREDRSYERVLTSDDSNFLAELSIHASGFLAPLISTIRVGWPSRLLRAGIVLVDLPGVGIAQDSYRQITKQYVRDQARAIVLVVDRAGPTQDSVELLRTSGYWDRLVGATDDPESDPADMLIAVTKVDDVATEHWRNLASENRPKKSAVYAELVQQFKTRMLRQVGDQLQQFGSTSHEIVKDARAEARARLLASLEIYPVSAPEYRKIILDDDDDRPFLKDVFESGVPTLCESLESLARKEINSRDRHIDEVFHRLCSSILSAFKLCRGRLELADPVTHESERIAREIEVVAGPKREERQLRVGAFREFLEGTAQTRIRELVLEARQVAQEEIQQYLNSLGDAHWATLRAAVRRGGAFVGRRAINLPVDIADRFQEPLAAVWSQRLLKDIRKRTSELAADMSRLVEEICDWAEAADADVKTELLEEQRARIARRVAVMKQIGKEAVDELREVVKRRLSTVIQKPIRAACKEFVTKGDDIGTGVKKRILELFNSLARECTTAAQNPAIEVLRQNFEKVRVEINDAFGSWGDPIQETIDIIIKRRTERLKTLDDGERTRMLHEIDALLQSAQQFI
jgi:GTP-binding protein EngB required for normal cell division